MVFDGDDIVVAHSESSILTSATISSLSSAIEASSGVVTVSSTGSGMRRPVEVTNTAAQGLLQLSTSGRYLKLLY